MRVNPLRNEYHLSFSRIIFYCYESAALPFPTESKLLPQSHQKTLSPIVMVHIWTVPYLSLAYILLYLSSSFRERGSQECVSTPYQVHVICPLVSLKSFESPFLSTFP